MMDDIQMMSMSFFSYQELDLNTARELLIYATNEYLTAINSNVAVRPYLHNYPFTAKNIEVIIFFYKKNGVNVFPGKISIAAANEGKVEYYTNCPDSQVIKSIYEETYEEALQKLPGT